MVARMHDSTGKVRVQQHLGVCGTGSSIHPLNKSRDVLCNELKPLLPGGLQRNKVLIQVLRRHLENTV